MTKRQRYEHKLGNALRAQRGILQKINVKGETVLPQHKAEARVSRWTFRLEQLQSRHVRYINDVSKARKKQEQAIL